MLGPLTGQRAAMDLASDASLLLMFLAWLDNRCLVPILIIVAGSLPLRDAAPIASHLMSHRSSVSLPSSASPFDPINRNHLAPVQHDYMLYFPNTTLFSTTFPRASQHLTLKPMTSVGSSGFRLPQISFALALHQAVVLSCCVFFEFPQFRCFTPSSLYPPLRSPGRLCDPKPSTVYVLPRSAALEARKDPTRAYGVPFEHESCIG